MNPKRSMLSLAAVLAATVLTGGAAVAGLVHRPAAAPPAAPVTVVHQAPAPASQSWSEGGD